METSKFSLAYVYARLIARSSVTIAAFERNWEQSNSPKLDWLTSKLLSLIYSTYYQHHKNVSKPYSSICFAMVGTSFLSHQRPPKRSLFTHVGGHGSSLQVFCLSSGLGSGLQYLSSTGVPLSSIHSTSERVEPIRWVKFIKNNRLILALLISAKKIRQTLKTDISKIISASYCSKIMHAVRVMREIKHKK